MKEYNRKRRERYKDDPEFRDKLLERQRNISDEQKKRRNAKHLEWKKNRTPEQIKRDIKVRRDRYYRITYGKMAGTAKIMYAAGIDWTMPSMDGWDNSSIAMHVADFESMGRVGRYHLEAAMRLKVKRIIMCE